MEQKKRRVSIAIYMTEQSSPPTLIRFETERDLESKLTTTELRTCVQNAITRLTKEVDYRRARDNYCGRKHIGKPSDTSLKTELSSKHGAPEYRWVDRNGQSRYTLVHFYNMQPDEEPDKIDYFEREEDAYALLHEKGKVMYIMGDEWRKASLSLM